MQAGGLYAGGVSGGVVKAITSSGIIEKFVDCVAVGGVVSFAATAAAGTRAYYNSQGKLNCGSTNDKKGGYRVDLQSVDGNPPCANLQLQLNVKNLNPSTVACVRFPVATTQTSADLIAAFYASLNAVRNDANACMALMT